MNKSEGFEAIYMYRKYIRNEYKNKYTLQFLFLYINFVINISYKIMGITKSDTDSWFLQQYVKQYKKLQF